MSLVFADFVKETTTTTGLGTYDLAGAVTGFRTFVAAVGDANTCYYAVNDGTDWEVGVGTVTDASPDTLARTSVVESSNAGSAVNWGAGTKEIYVSNLATLVSKSLQFTRGCPLITESGTTRTLDRDVDAGAMIACSNSSGCSVTIPPAATSDFDIGDEVHLVDIDGTGTVSFSEGSGVTINYNTNLYTASACNDVYIPITAKKIATNTWLVFGFLYNA